jgi:hypothetical protein
MLSLLDAIPHMKGHKHLWIDGLQGMIIKQRKELLQLALEGLKHNYSLESLHWPWPTEMVHSKQEGAVSSLERKLSSLLDANWGGRRLLQQEMNEGLSPLWPFILERINHAQLPQRPNHKYLVLAERPPKRFEIDRSWLGRRANVLYGLLRERVMLET